MAQKIFQTWYFFILLCLILTHVASKLILKFISTILIWWELTLKKNTDKQVKLKGVYWSFNRILPMLRLFHKHILWYCSEKIVLVLASFLHGPAVNGCCQMFYMRKDNHRFLTPWLHLLLLSFDCPEIIIQIKQEFFLTKRMQFKGRGRTND